LSDFFRPTAVQTRPPNFPGATCCKLIFDFGLLTGPFLSLPVRPEKKADDLGAIRIIELTKSSSLLDWYIYSAIHKDNYNLISHHHLTSPAIILLLRIDLERVAPSDYSSLS
jgi:hypothetical protein